VTNLGKKADLPYKSRPIVVSTLNSAQASATLENVHIDVNDIRPFLRDGGGICDREVLRW